MAAGMRKGVRAWLGVLSVLAVVLVLWGAGTALAETTTTVTTPPSAVPPVDPKEYVQGCFSCHGQVSLTAAGKGLYLDPVVYESSVHGMLACNGCHIGFSHDPHAPVDNAAAFAEIAREACRNCHANQFAMYESSYHGTLTKGQSAEGQDAPDCVDCHGAHDVKAVGSPGYRQDIAGICGRCHGGREKTYLDTYHGKAVSSGQRRGRHVHGLSREPQHPAAVRPGVHALFDRISWPPVRPATRLPRRTSPPSRVHITATVAAMRPRWCSGCPSSTSC